MDDRRGLELTQSTINLSEVFAKNDMRLFAKANAFRGWRKPIAFSHDVSDELYELRKMIAELINFFGKLVHDLAVFHGYFLVHAF